MSNNKFHKILSDTITLPLLPADKFNETNTGYYAVLEKNYIPITSDIECIYKPDWITGYKFIKEGEKDNETNDALKYYNKLIITSISDNPTEKLRKDVMEFAVRNNVLSLTPINHIYAKVSLVPKENIEVHLEFIPTEVLNGHLNKDGGVISGDELEIHIKYWAVLNKRNLSNVTLNLNGNLLDKNKIKSLKINSSDNTVELVYLIDENIGSLKTLEFEAIFKTQYNEVNQQKSIILNVNTYTITLDIDKPNPVIFNGDNRILTYKCTYTDGINVKPKEVKDNLLLEFSYSNTLNQINYSVIKTIYVDGEFKTTINVDENYTSEQRYLNVNVVYDNGSNKLKSTVKQIIQDKSKIKLLYYVEYLDRNTTETPSTNGTYNVSAFGETIRLHYYGIIEIDKKNSVKITNVTNIKNNISTTYTINALVDTVLYNNVTLNGDEYILDINFDRNERASITKTINFNMDNNLNIPTASCNLTLGVLSIDLTIKHEECTDIIGGIPEYNNIILVFRAYDTTKRITIEDVNLYTITCDNDDVNLLDIQYEIITYDNINYVVASNIRCKNIYDKKVDRRLTFTVKYNSKTVSHVVTLKSVVYACEIRPSSNYVSALGEDKFEVISVGIIKDGYLDNKHLETSVDNVLFTNTYDDNTPGYIHVIQSNRKLVNKSLSIIKVDPLDMDGDVITSKKHITFRIKVKYHDSTNYYDIKQLYLLIYVELYKDSSYSTLLEYESKKLCISPFINNILYYKCYVCEINKDDGSLKKIDISKFLRKEFSIYYDDRVVVLPNVDENPTYNKEDYTYRGKITILRYICSKDITYQFRYMLYYSNGNSNRNKYIFKTLNIYKPEIKTTPDNENTLSGTYIQYRSDKDYSTYNDDKSILKIGTDDKGISSKGYLVTLYYRTVFMIVLPDNANYIYGNSYKTYIDLDKKHFLSFVNISDIIIDNNIAFSHAEEVTFNDSSYLKITFDVNKNDGLTKRIITKSITYQFTDDNINGTDYYYTLNAFTNYTDNPNNRIEIYLDGASLDLSAFFDNNKAGVLSDSSRIITYNAKPLLKQNLHVRVLLNGELQPTLSEYFKFKDNNTFLINRGTLDSSLNTYKSEYNLTDIYIEPENKTYKFYYCYNGTDENNTKTNDLTVIRTSFGRDDKCTLNAEIDKSEISNNGDTVKITFWLTYTNNEIIDLGTDAIGNFIYKFGKNDEVPVSIKPSSNTFTVVYDQKTKKYSFVSTIKDNPTINSITYKFIIQFGDDKHKKTLTCTLSRSSYTLNATIEPLTLSPLSPSNIKIICSVKKDNKEEIYQGVLKENFSITQVNETKDENGNSRLTVLSTPPSGLLQGEYGKEYKVADNKTKDPITYEFKCSYNLNGQNLSAKLSITLEGATFNVSIYDSETDLSKQNIVNPVGEIKTINYFGILNGKHILNSEEVKFTYETEGAGVDLIDEVQDTENNVLSRKYKFGLNNTANTITYKFTVTYQNISKSISFTQKPGEIKLILKNNPDPIPKSGGLCKIIYYGYVGPDPNIKENHVTTDLVLNESTEVEGFMSYTPTKVSGPIITDYLIEYVFSVPARVEDINIDKLFKRNWTVTYKNGDVQKIINKDIVQNGDSEFFPAFDIFGLVYEWNNGGCDLDTATLLTRSDNGSLIIADTDVDICKNSFGFSQSNNSNSTKVYNYIAFSGDNQQGCGYESIAINFKKLLSDFNLSKLNITLNFDIWMTWYAGRWDGNVNIKFVRYTDISFKTYNDGTYKDDNIQFYGGSFNPLKSYLYLLNNDIDLLDTTNSSIKITEKLSNVDSKGSSGEYKTTYAKVGRLKYNTKSKTAILSINQIANSSTRAVIRKQKMDLNINNLYTDVYYPDYKGYTYSLGNLFLTDNNIQKGITVKMKMLYRDSSVSTPIQKNLSYVDSEIGTILLYSSSTDYTYTSLSTTHNYYNEILSKDKYVPKSNNINICEFPDIDINSITQPPTSIDNKRYYGLYGFYIRYSYKYTIKGSDSCIFTFSRYVYVGKKI